MELGISTFAELTPDPKTGETLSPAQRMKNLMEEIQLADQVGLDVYAIGEHHRPDFVVSSPATVLAAAAMITKNIKLSSAVTVLGSEDPVRVFQQFAHVDLLSEGRAEIMAGRGSFIESFPLFGQDLNDYDAIFAEKLDLLLQLNKSEQISWRGKFRPAIANRGVFPRPYQQEIPVWLAVGGTPQSVVRAAEKGLPLALAIIGGSPDRFTYFTDLYRQSWIKAGRNQEDIQIAVHSHGFIGADSQQAADDFYAPYALVMTQLGKERGWPPMNRGQYDAMRAKDGSLVLGSTQEVIEKILMQQEMMGLTRYLLHLSVGTMPHDKLMKAIELYGDVVAPAIRKALKK
ncbi:LLM class flavin-dependent oxidoreductase [Algoriphagus sp. AGSA1]|uniref:LLM class flavin-dependent oxidoreductase n=1 Tax=Algoriphagus sp. AGSA1 TaxID=2907213 RepID=UPI001F388100|nr:LLM class flavin-dependent oxidoreductase [Algoriphagus sp. AGSA1]MCE7057376.1 LLM class flavin-dependent oxidoreductase [Algoriphagus sp. AGSA1]